MIHTHISAAGHGKTTFAMMQAKLAYEMGKEVFYAGELTPAAVLRRASVPMRDLQKALEANHQFSPNDYLIIDGMPWVMIDSKFSVGTLENLATEFPETEILVTKQASRTTYLEVHDARLYQAQHAGTLEPLSDVITASWSGGRVLKIQRIRPEPAVFELPLCSQAFRALRLDCPKP